MVTTTPDLGDVTLNGRGWESYFNLSEDFRVQEGQVAAFELAAAVQPADTETVRWLFRLCTGYGKTLLAYGVFWILKQRGIVDRMLVLTQSDDQRKQFAEDAADARRLLGIDVRSWVIEKKERDLRAVRENRADVFVGTYQQLRETDSFIRDMLDFRDLRWMVAADECHHLAIDGLWARRQEDLPNVRVRAGLSATPERNDAKALLGLPLEPTVCVDYAQAYKEKVVKRVEGHIQAYSVWVDMEGRRQELTTDDLRGVTDYNKFETRRQLRYVSGYVDRMLLDALEDLCGRNRAYPGQNQMLAFCMSCQHAEHVCDQIKRLASAHHLPVEARWAGVGKGLDGLIKPSAENRAILDAFKAGTFAALVQVAIAGEGFNNPRVSVIAFLHLIGADNTLVQQLGRGVRRNRAIPFEDDTLSVYASSDTPIADVIRDMESDAARAAIEMREGEQAEPGEEKTRCLLYEIPDLVVVDAAYQRTDMVFARGTNPLPPEMEALRREFGITLERMLQAYRPPQRHAPAPHAPTARSEQDLLHSLEGQVEVHVSKLARSMLGLLREDGMEVKDQRHAKEIVGRLKKSIHAQWKYVSHRGHREMMREDFEEKNRWLQRVAEEIRQTRQVPLWVRL